MAKPEQRQGEENPKTLQQGVHEPLDSRLARVHTKRQNPSDSIG